MAGNAWIWMPTKKYSLGGWPVLVLSIDVDRKIMMDGRFGIGLIKEDAECAKCPKAGHCKDYKVEYRLLAST